MSYQQLSFHQRCQIKTLLQVDVGVARISQEIGVHRSTIYREIKRNKVKLGYSFRLAHRKALKRRQARAKPYVLTHRIIRIIEAKLVSEQWSPEQISGYLEKTAGTTKQLEALYTSSCGIAERSARCTARRASAS